MADIDLDPLNYDSQYSLNRAVQQAVDEANNAENHIRELNRKIKAQQGQKGGPDKSLLDEARATRDKINARRAFEKSARAVSQKLPAMPSTFASAADKEEAMRRQFAQSRITENKYKLDDVMDLTPGQVRTLETLKQKGSGVMNAIRGIAPITPGWMQAIGMAINPLTLGMSPQRLGAAFGAGGMADDPRKRSMISQTTGADSGVTAERAMKNPEALIPSIESEQKFAPGTTARAQGEKIGDLAIEGTRNAAREIKQDTQYRGGLGAGVKAANTLLYGGAAGTGLYKWLADDPATVIADEEALTPEQRDFVMQTLEPFREKANIPKIEERLKGRRASETSAAKAIMGRIGSNPLTTAFTMEDFDSAFPYDKGMDDKIMKLGTIDEISDPKNRKKLNNLFKDADKSQPIMLGMNKARAKVAVFDKSLEGGLGGWAVAEIPFGAKGMSLNYEEDELDRRFDASVKTMKDYRLLPGGEEAIKSFKAKGEEKRKFTPQ